MQKRISLSTSKGMTYMWALLLDGTYETNGTYVSGHMSPIGLICPIGSQCGACAPRVS